MFSPVCENREQTLKPISSLKKDWFLYLLDAENGLSRLNLSQSCERSSPDPVIELVDDFSQKSRRRRGGAKCLPWGMTPIILGSKVYLVGGGRQSRSCYITPNLDVYSFDPTDSEPEGPCVRLCKEGPIPIASLVPATSFPLVFHLEEKLYLLETIPREDPPIANKNKKFVGQPQPQPQPPFFQVFDPVHQSRKLLPHPSFYDDKSLCETFNCIGYKIYLCLKSYHHDVIGAYIFDTRQEKWECTKNYEILSGQFKAVAELCKGFMIGIPDVMGRRNEFVVYQLDDNGIPKPYQVLHELRMIFCPFVRVGECYMGECGGDGRMWFAYDAVAGAYDSQYISVAVFRVSISNDLAGSPVFSANIEAAEFYVTHYSSCYGIPFVMCHEHLNKHHIEEKD